MNDVLKEVSITGRLAYAMMCAERYLQNTYPQKDWRPVFEKFWDVCNAPLWDDWREITSEMLPECLLEFDNYERLGYTQLSKEEYLILKKLYSGVGKDVNFVLNSIRDIEEVHSYSSISGQGKESLNVLEKLVDRLQQEGIEPPDPQLVMFSKFSEKNGWGDPFDGKRLSIVLGEN